LSNGASPTARRGLGRGLEVLIGGPGASLSQLAQIPVDAIHANPRQPRRRFEPEATSGLASSIRQQGLLQPVVVRPRVAGGYELIAGERRWRAAKEAGIAELPALVRDADDRDTLLLALVENVAR
jgi:ParB family chromosome partitioning protein